MKECSYLPRALPASLALVAVLSVAGSRPAPAQERYRAARAENFRLDPQATGRLLARVSRGTQLIVRDERSNWMQVTLEGWIWSQSVRPDTRGGFDLRVSAANGENLRARPNGPVLAQLLNGFLMEELARQGDWIRVRRLGWMWKRSLEPVATAAASPRGGTAAPRPSGATLDRARVAGETGLLRTADGDSVGHIRPGASVRVVSRSGEWVRVQVDGWVRATELDTGGGDVLAGVTGTEVRSRPQDFEGQLLQWTLQYIAVPASDELRREIPAGSRYLLARGPVPERGFVYVILPDDRVAEVEALEPLVEITIIGRVRTGRSHYLGNPVLELVDLMANQH